MKRIWLNEWKRVSKTKVFFINIMLAIIMAVFILIYGLVTSKSDLAIGDGNIAPITGMKALKTQAKYDSVIEGEVTGEKLTKGLEIFWKSYDEEKDDYYYTQELLEYAAMWGLISDAVYYYPEANNFSVNSFYDIPRSVANDFYKYREDKLNRMLLTSNLSEESQSEIQEMNKNIEQPFKIYRNYRAWEFVLEFLPVFACIILILGMFFSASIFSETYENGINSIIQTTKSAGKQIGFAKIGVCIVYTIVLYFIGHLVFLGGAVFIFGIEGLRTSIQAVNVFSVANLNLATAIGLQLLAGLISCIAMSITATFLSAKQSKSINALFSGIAFFAVYELVNFFLVHMNSFIDILLTIIPISGTGTISMIQQYNSVLDILGTGIWIPYVSIIAGIIWGIVVAIVTIRIYAKQEC